MVVAFVIKVGVDASLAYNNPSTMLLLTALTAAILPLSVFSVGQIPAVDGVIGGVPSSNSLHVLDIDQAQARVEAASPTTPGKLRVVENSGVCGTSNNISKHGAVLNGLLETTPGVFQASGYGDLTATESIWYVDVQILIDFFIYIVWRFWYFASRHNNNTAPFTLWFNGGMTRN